MHVSVALVLDPSFGDRVAKLAQQMPVWLVSSSANDQAARVARATLCAAQITTLSTRSTEAVGDLLARALYAIDEHHGALSQLVAYDTLWVYGTTEKIPPELARELGFKSIAVTADGFKAEKLSSHLFSGE